MCVHSTICMVQSAAFYVGANLLGELARQLENLPTATPHDDVRRKSIEVRAELRRTCDAIRTHLGEKQTPVANATA